jgi:hypothetical protein
VSEGARPCDGRRSGSPREPPSNWLPDPKRRTILIVCSRRSCSIAEARISLPSASALQRAASKAVVGASHDRRGCKHRGRKPGVSGSAMGLPPWVRSSNAGAVDAAAEPDRFRTTAATKARYGTRLGPCRSPIAGERRARRSPDAGPPPRGREPSICISSRRSRGVGLGDERAGRPRGRVL